MKETKELQALNSSRRTFDTIIEGANQRFEAHRAEIHAAVDASEARIASLESSLELFYFLEQERMAAQTGQELAAAIEEHHRIVDEARRKLATAAGHYVSAFSAAATAMEASYNAAVARD